MILLEISQRHLVLRAGQKDAIIFSFDATRLMKFKCLILFGELLDCPTMETNDSRRRLRCRKLMEDKTEVAISTRGRQHALRRRLTPERLTPLDGLALYPIKCVPDGASFNKERRSADAVHSIFPASTVSARCAEWGSFVNPV